VSRVVLDASAVLALLHSEPGAEMLTQKAELLENAVVGAVNAAEVHGKLVSKGMPSEEAWAATSAAAPEIVAFDRQQAKIAGSLLPQTSSLGLSLADRACLALAIALNAPVYTADRKWKNLNVGISIRMIR
jgi:ribonuclease VapC